MKKVAYAGLLALFPISSFAGVLWENDPVLVNGQTTGYVSDGISTNGSQLYAEALGDHFSLTSAATVSSISFWGGSSNDFDPSLSNFNSFDIYIYDTSFNVVYSTQVARSSLTVTATGYTSDRSAPDYKFTYSAPFSLSGGQYWLHVGSVNATPSGDGFNWDAATGDGVYAVNYFDGTGWNTYTTTLPNNNQAFEIEGVPEPTTVAAFGLGLAALLRKRRR